MPYFELQNLPQSFINNHFSPELQAKVADGGAGLVHEAMVLTGPHTFETVIVVSSWHSGQLHRSWESTQISDALADQLYTDQTDTLLLYSQQTDRYHRFPVDGQRRRDGLAQGAILGWRHILEQFDVIGLTPKNRALVLIAKDGSLCFPRLPSEEES